MFGSLRAVYLCLCLVLFVICLDDAASRSILHSALAEEDKSGTSLKAAMADIYESFQKLQILLLDKEKFALIENRPLILKHVRALNSGLRFANKGGLKFRSSDDFGIKIATLKALLDTAEGQLEDGEVSWARRRLKTVSNHCVSCHLNYAPKLRKLSRPIGDALDNPYLRAEMYLIARDFEKAIDSFYLAARKSASSSERMDILMKWIMLSVHFVPNPEPTLKKLSALRSELRFSEYDGLTIDEWIESLAKWKTEKKSNSRGIEKARTLLGQGKEGKAPYEIELGTVELLRAAAILEPLILELTPAKSQLPSEGHRQALYLLGLAYARLPSFLINEMPDVFLEQCIRTYPGSREAKKSFQLYRDLLTQPYIYGNESKVPESIKEDILKLRALAYGKSPNQ